MKKLLFALRDRSGELVKTENNVEYFETKLEAKVRRNALRETGSDVFVTRGPDHMRGASDVND